MLIKIVFVFYINFVIIFQIISTTNNSLMETVKMNKNQKGNLKRNEERISITFPGTKWCGPGNVANDYEDLGKYKETDKCCREHDNCDNIESGQEKYGLKNDDWFTRLHCKCDRNFYNCLHAINSTESNVIGRQYFLLRDRCYKNEYPIEGCDEYQTRIFTRRCIKYKLNKQLNKKYQWFDLPFYDIETYPDDQNFYRSQYQKQKEHQDLLSSNEI